MKISSLTLTILLASSPAAAVASHWAAASSRSCQQVAFASRHVAKRPNAALLSMTTGEKSSSDEELFPTDAAANLSSDAADKTFKVAAPILSDRHSFYTSPHVMKKIATTSALATAMSSSLPLAAMATSIGSSDFSSSMDSSSIMLNYGEMFSSLQFLYTAVLVTGVGYTQRMAGREDFKREMAMKIANGEITPEELVEEIRVMAEEINQSANVAYSAQMEVQKLLAETRAIASNTLQLPSADTSTLPKFSLGAVEEKEYIPAFEPQNEEKEEALPYQFAVDSEDEEETIPYEFVVNEGSEATMTNGYQKAEEEEEEEEEEVTPLFFSETTTDETTETTLPQEDDEYEEFMAIEAETDFIADALLAPPPSLRSAPGAEENVKVENTEDDYTMEEEPNNIEENQSSDADRLVDEIKAKEDERRLLEEKRESIRQQAEAIRSSFKSASSGDRDLDVSNAFKLAEEALAFASSANGSAEAEEKFSGTVAVATEESFVSPSPPDLPPPLDLVMESVEIEAQPNSQPEIKVSAPKAEAKPVVTGPVRSSPLARVLAGELGINIEDVFPGTGLKGRVVADDVRKYAAEIANA